MDTKTLEKLQRIYDQADNFGKSLMEKEFPELKESEGESIRKEIISYLKGCYGFTSEEKEITKHKSWIEWMEKKGEQKSTNKEPKFKVGDWIINSEGMLRHIIDVDKTGYQTDNGWLAHDTYEREFHLWTIEDAKEGDVLCYNDDVFILKYYILFSTVACHYCYNKYCFMPNHAYSIIKKDFSKIHPATKEQRDFLFQKIKNLGYEWNNKEKELKIESKSSWSEEDEHNMNKIIACLRGQINSDLPAMTNWIKSIKQRLTIQTEESE